MKNSSPSSVEEEIRARLARIILQQRGVIVQTTPVLERLKADPARILSDGGRHPDPWQASLLRGASKRMLLLCSRQAGKSTVAAALALKAALLSPEPALVLLLSPTQRQSGELFRDKVKRLYNSLGRPVATTQESQLTVEFANGSRILSLPGDEETIRGYSGVTLLVIDEASRVEDDLYRSVRPMLAVSGGGLVALSTPFGKRGWFYEEWHGECSPWDRVRITADQCPRISPEFLAEERRSMGDEWFRQEYQCEFTDGGGSPLFPHEWLVLAEQRAAAMKGKARKAKAIGIDPAEGGDSTALCAVDEFGVIELIASKTPDTNVIVGAALGFIRKHGVDPDRVCIDRGGGGKQLADRLRGDHGLTKVRTIAFGGTVSLEPKRGAHLLASRKEAAEDRYVYVNRRAQLYHDLRVLLDPASGSTFGLPAEFPELRRQLSPMPLLYDNEGRVLMLPKNAPSENYKGLTLVKLIGRSPDEADSLVLACHGMLHETQRVRIGAR